MTLLTIDAHLVYDLPAAADLLLQVEVAAIAGQAIRSGTLTLPKDVETHRIPAEAALGERIWMHVPEGRFDVRYEAEVDVTRPPPDLSGLPATAYHDLTPEATSFLMPSRYCPSDLFLSTVLDLFGGLRGGAQAQAIRDWIHDHFAYVPGASDASTTALDSYMLRQGICRDYAHVFVAMARAVGLPARVASVYAPGVDPPDFHAVAEVWLADAWHLVDPTGMAGPEEIAVIGIGRDAAEVSFMTIQGRATLVEQTVSCTRGDEARRE